ncbi:MAG: RNA polymerase subunit sigma [Phycisphaerales bacterium]|nr:RNA polymerase subunit sigma [Phycisphaerales bacterium]
MSSEPSQPQDPTLLMNAAAGGDKAAADRLLPLVYDHLRKAAQFNVGGERVGHTLSATALVHEAYLRLVGPREVAWAGRGHFYAAAAQAMRRILLDHARSRARRGGAPRRLDELGDVAALASADPDQILAVDAAIKRLESEDREAAAMVRLRFYAGLSVDQAAQALGHSPRTAARLWSYARAVLYRELGEHT